ncbi:MAG: DMT family transporter [Betaproteobacteria bacterium]
MASPIPTLHSSIANSKGTAPAWLPFVVLGAAVLIVSSAAIMIRLAQAEGISSLSIAAWRLTLAAAVLWPLVWRRNQAEIQALSSRDWLFGGISGIFLALHFASWISSLAYTSVASSLALVSTNPVWIALVSWLVFREKLSAWLIVGIAAAAGGSALIFHSDSQLAATPATSNAMLGNTLAVIGSMTVCGYLLIGRKSRKTVSLIPYIWLVYSAAAFVLMAMALIAGASLTGYSAVGWLCLLALALGPQLLGHSAFNWALKHVSATFIAIAILGEPVGSALLAWMFFGEAFAPLQLTGFCLLLAGIYLASRSERRDA